MKTKSYKSQVEFREGFLVKAGIGMLLLFLLLILIKVTGCFGQVPDMKLPMTEIVSFFIGFETVNMVRLVRLKRILADQEKVEELEIYEKDERNRMVQLKSFQLCGWAVIFVLCIGWMVSVFLNMTVCYTLSTVIIVLLIIYGLCRWYYERKY